MRVRLTLCSSRTGTVLLPTFGRTTVPTSKFESLSQTWTTQTLPVRTVRLYCLIFAADQSLVNSSYVPRLGYRNPLGGGCLWRSGVLLSSAKCPLPSRHSHHVSRCIPCRTPHSVELKNLPCYGFSFVAWPFGKILEWVLPIGDFEIPDWVSLLGGSKFTLNPGPFNIKEHSLISMLGLISEIYPYSIGVTATSSIKYGRHFSIG